MSSKCKKSFPSLVKRTYFEGHNYIGRFSKIYNCSVGFASYIGSSCSLNRLAIGRFCSIGSNVCVVFGSHPTSFVSTHPAFYSPRNCTGLFFNGNLNYEELKYVDHNEQFFAKIGNDVWVGNNTLILQGVEIGDGAIVAAGSVVTKNVEPYSIVGGVPAKIIRYRFDEETIKKMLKLSWWNKDVEWLKENSQLFCDPRLLGID